MESQRWPTLHQPAFSVPPRYYRGGPFLAKTTTTTAAMGRIMEGGGEDRGMLHCCSWTRRETFDGDLFFSCQFVRFVPHASVFEQRIGTVP